ncbi:MAG: hypothetical protein OXC95_15960 [Dehalococcoidia bacterium]|nr:hypothetical protein [Dehalococcoidia bacterium]
MVTVPGFLLRRLYVKQSLKNTDEGFEFSLLNRLGSGYALRMLPLTLDGRQLPLDSAAFWMDGKLTGFHEISQSNTLTLAMNRSIVVRVAGTTLEAGPHKVGMGFDVPGLGALSFDFTDTVSDE